MNSTTNTTSTPEITAPALEHPQDFDPHRIPFDPSTNHRLQEFYTKLKTPNLEIEEVKDDDDDDDDDADDDDNIEIEVEGEYSTSSKQQKALERSLPQIQSQNNNNSKINLMEDEDEKSPEPKTRKKLFVEPDLQVEDSNEQKLAALNLRTPPVTKNLNASPPAPSNLNSKFKSPRNLNDSALKRVQQALQKGENLKSLYGQALYPKTQVQWLQGFTINSHEDVIKALSLIIPLPSNNNKFLNLAYLLIDAISHLNPSMKSMLQDLLSGAESPELLHYMNYIQFQSRDSFHIMDYSNPHISKLNKPREYALLRLGLLKNQLADILCFLLETLCKRCRFSSRIRCPTNLESAKMNLYADPQYEQMFRQTKKSKHKPSKYQAPQLDLQKKTAFYDLHVLKPCTENGICRWTSQIANSLQFEPGNSIEMKNTSIFSLFREFHLKGIDHESPVFYLAAALGAIEISEGNYQIIDPTEGTCFTLKGEEFTDFSSLLPPPISQNKQQEQQQHQQQRKGTSVFSQQQQPLPQQQQTQQQQHSQQPPQADPVNSTALWMTHSEMKLFLNKSFTDGDLHAQIVYKLLGPANQLTLFEDQTFTLHRDQAETESHHVFSQFSSCAASMDDSLVLALFERLNQTNYSQIIDSFLIMKDLKAEDDWSLYYQWEAFEGDVFIITLYGACRYLRSLAKRTIQAEKKRLRSLNLYDHRIEEILQNYIKH